MRVALLLALLCAIHMAIGDDTESSKSLEIPETTTEILKTESRRQARQLNLPVQDYPMRGSYSQTRQVIKLPSNARVKVVPVQQQSQRPNRGRVNNFNTPPPPIYQHRQKNHQQNRPKRGPFDEEDYYEEEFKIPKKARRTKQGYMVQDVSPEEFYEDDEFDYLKKQKKPYSYVLNTKTTKKKNKKHEYQYDTNPQASNAYRRPVYDEDTGYEFSRIRNRDRTPAPSNYYDDGYGYDDYAMSSSITMKQVPPPNLAADPPMDFLKESHSVKKQMNNDHYERYPTEATPHRKPHSNRQMQSLFPQHYTTHNPYVTRNFGLEENERTGYFDGHHEFEDHEPASSDMRPSLIPTGSSGIHIVKPPQFSNSPLPTVTTPHSNQRATIRDILKQDCPDAEVLGYCASPPRYPTQQINQIMVKCAEMIDAMYAPAPADPEDDLSSFSSRSDEQDIEFIDTNSEGNVTNTVETWSQWSRSDSEGSNTVCASSPTQTEPGYAKEVTSGRWFVIMQTMDSIVQRVMTDICQRPGKPCAGLAGLKCSRGSSSQHGYKATRCVQRHTQQRLISWDPEMPLMCPKVRVFQFPTACLCHLSVD